MEEMIRERLRFGVLTVSDSTSRGEREDLSGPLIIELLEKAGYTGSGYSVVPDEAFLISRTLTDWSEEGTIDLILTTGGTGFSPRDVTPEAPKSVCDRDVPGIPEMLRSRSAEEVPAAWLSRGSAGICKKTLIINLPGSSKAVRECIGFLLPILDHALEVLSGNVTRCGT